MATEEINLTPAELDELGAKLDKADLSEKDRKILVAAFAVAAQAISGEDDVEGFLLRAPSSFSSSALASPSLASGLNAGFSNSLNQGALNNFNNQAIIISVGF